MAGRAGRRAFGAVRRLPSGRWQASYVGPDGRRHTARTPAGKPLTFAAKQDADGWLALRRAEILRGAWLPPAADHPPPPPPLTFGEYAGGWLAGRDLSPATRELYRDLLSRYVLPAFGGQPLTAITPAAVRAWHARLAAQTGPTRRAHAYALLRTILRTAVDDDQIAASPCRVRGGGTSRRARAIRPATLAELEQIAAGVPARYRLMVLLAAWCALRFGELAELRRGDVDLRAGVIRVRRAVTRPGGKGRLVKAPKSEAGARDVAIPPHLLPAVRDHLREHVAAHQGALLFPSARDPAVQMAPSALYAVYWPARERAGRPDLRFHDLRHTGATLAAAAGATLAELMARLGHATPGAALIYQHAAGERDKLIAAALSELAAGGPAVPLSRARERRARAAGAGPAGVGDQGSQAGGGAN